MRRRCSELGIPGLVTLAALAGACGGDDEATPDGPVAADAAVTDAPAPDAGCVKRWKVLPVGAATHSAAVSGGALTLSSQGSRQGSVLSVKSLATLTGDFTATFTWEAWVSGGAGAFVQAVVVEEPAQVGSTLATAGVGSLPGTANPGASAALQPGAVDLQATAATSGTFSYTRTGDQITITTTPSGGAAATITGALGTTAVSIGLQIGANVVGPIAGQSHIAVSDFTVTGGGGAVAGDDFACDSLE